MVSPELVTQMKYLVTAFGLRDVLDTYRLVESQVTDPDEYKGRHRRRASDIVRTAMQQLGVPEE